MGDHSCEVLLLLVQIFQAGGRKRGRAKKDNGGGQGREARLAGLASLARLADLASLTSLASLTRLCPVSSLRGKGAGFVRGGGVLLWGIHIYEFVP